jgi:hypothetical protein
MPNDSVTIERHIKTDMLNTCVITGNAELRSSISGLALSIGPN